MSIASNFACRQARAMVEDTVPRMEHALACLDSQAPVATSAKLASTARTARLDAAQRLHVVVQAVARATQRALARQG